MNLFEDYYEILQVHHLAEPEVIKAAYRKLLGKYHPDHNSSPVAAEKTRKIIMAYDVLKDPEKRRFYDAEWLRKKVQVQSPRRIAKSEDALQIDRDVVEFNVIPDVIPPPQIIILKNAGKDNLEGALVPRQKWIKISPRTISFNDRQNIQVQIDTSRLTTDIMGYVDIRTNSGHRTITVKATISHPQIKPSKKKGLFF